MCGQNTAPAKGPCAAADGPPEGETEELKIVVVGDGKVGYALTEQLAREEHDLTVIDSNASVLKESVESLDVMVVGGNGASLETQTEAGVGESDLLIAVTAADEVNLLCCILARKLGCRHTIARVRNPEYRRQVEFLRAELGLSMVINPERSAAEEIFRMLQFPSFIKRDSFAKGRVELVEIKIREGSPLAGKQLLDLYKTAGVRVLVCAVERGDEVFIPSGASALEAGDKITVTAATNDLTRLIKNLGITEEKIRDVMIVGGGRIALYLAILLLDAGVDVKVIEKDPQRCRVLAEKLPRAMVICGDGSSQKLLIAEGISDADAVIPLTGMDEENLMISMYACDMGTPKTITKINRAEYEAVFQRWGIDSTVNPKLLSATEIVRYVRDMGNSGGGSVLTMHRIAGGRAEALEFRVRPGGRYLDIPLSKLPVKQGYLIACINRHGSILIPSGSDCLRAGDTAVVVASSESAISELDEMFGETVASEDGTP